ncbi:hypothetical protein CEXT_598071 [Caerostris extrusa]|uniref:Uncharacterized protein n=1 Tax=Caerostris extrusa TaxID=172846 RepID=A0AAV4NR26_CAEEX|nr:hypothetical protein CEXT_598071 [Caerostris extrusa]
MSLPQPEELHLAMIAALAAFRPVIRSVIMELSPLPYRWLLKMMTPSIYNNNKMCVGLRYTEARPIIYGSPNPDGRVFSACRNSKPPALATVERLAHDTAEHLITVLHWPGASNNVVVICSKVLIRCHDGLAWNQFLYVHPSNRSPSPGGACRVSDHSESLRSHIMEPGKLPQLTALGHCLLSLKLQPHHVSVCPDTVCLLNELSGPLHCSPQPVSEVSTNAFIVIQGCSNALVTSGSRANASIVQKSSTHCRIRRVFSESLRLGIVGRQRQGRAI